MAHNFPRTNLLAFLFLPKICWRWQKIRNKHVLLLRFAMAPFVCAAACVADGTYTASVGRSVGWSFDVDHIVSVCIVLPCLSNAWTFAFRPLGEIFYHWQWPNNWYTCTYTAIAIFILIGTVSCTLKRFKCNLYFCKCFGIFNWTTLCLCVCVGNGVVGQF